MPPEQFIFQAPQPVIRSPKRKKDLLLRRIKSPADRAGGGGGLEHPFIIPVQTSLVQTRFWGRRVDCAEIVVAATANLFSVSYWTEGLLSWHGLAAHEVPYSAPIDGIPSIQAIAQATLSPKTNSCAFAYIGRVRPMLAAYRKPRVANPCHRETLAAIVSNLRAAQPRQALVAVSVLR